MRGETRSIGARPRSSWTRGTPAAQATLAIAATREAPTTRWTWGTRWTRWTVALLVAYKRWLSPLLPRSCRFSPTCSEYARLALLKYGFWRGGARGGARLLRCHPFHPGGIDLP